MGEVRRWFLLKNKGSAHFHSVNNKRMSKMLETVMDEVEVVAKSDLQPLVDKLKKAVGYGGEYEFRLFAEEFLVAWEGKK